MAVRVPDASTRLRKRELFESIGYRPHAGQLLVHRSTALRRVLVCGVRWGKTLCASMEAVTALLEPRGNAIGWTVGPQFDVSERVFSPVVRVIEKHFPHRLHEYDPRGRKLVVVNFGGGLSELRGKSADNVDSLLGEGLNFLIIDEAARIKAEVWQEALSQRLIDRQGWALLVSTAGECDHWFFRLHKRGLKGRDPQFESWTAPSWQNPYLSRESIEAERARLPSEIFEAQYEGTFQGIDTEPCPVCENPGSRMRGIIIVVDGQEPGRCDECGGFVDSEGRNAMARDADGHPRITFVRVQDRPGGEPCVFESRQPPHESSDQPGVLSSGDSSFDLAS